MKLSNLFMIALLAGTLGVLGCDTARAPTTNDAGTGGTGGAGGTGGTGGTGGNGTGGGDGACSGPLCALQAAAKEACNELIGECNTSVAQVEIPEETCDLIGNEVFCERAAQAALAAAVAALAAGNGLGCAQAART